MQRCNRCLKSVYLKSKLQAANAARDDPEARMATVIKTPGQNVLGVLFFFMPQLYLDDLPRCGRVCDIFLELFARE